MTGPDTGRTQARALAFDIGTTTIVGALAVPEDGQGGTGGRWRIERTVSEPNPQARWGADLISRVNAAEADPDAARAMHGALIGACNDIIGSLGCAGAAVDSVAMAGNPVMEHLLLGLSTAPFARPPFRPSFRDGRTIDSAALAFDLPPETPVYVFPLVGGFVGGDAVAVALSLGLGAPGTGAAIAIDIGTNTEIILSAGGEVYATSAAAGPAFEGGNLSGGMTATRGAISGVRIDGEGIALDVIGGVTPRGICGSGIIEAASVMLASAVMERTGRIRDRDEVETNLAGRITSAQGGNSFVLFRGASGTVEVTQEDVRALQTAKSAIRAGISVLLRKAGIGEDDVTRVCLAGAFGSHLDPASLAAIGVIPHGWAARAGFSGDAALDGVVRAVASAAAREEAERMARAMRHVPLSGSAHFEREFMRNIDF